MSSCVERLVRPFRHLAAARPAVCDRRHNSAKIASSMRSVLVRSQPLPMNERGRSVVVTLSSSLIGLMVILALNLSAHRPISKYPPRRAPRDPAPLSPGAFTVTQQDQSGSRLYSPSNVLELPRASLDFVGYWGGWVRGYASSTGESPSHVGVVFGRRDDRVFFASELYSPA